MKLLVQGLSAVAFLLFAADSAEAQCLHQRKRRRMLPSTAA
jgi:hypothetical protein